MFWVLRGFFPVYYLYRYIQYVCSIVLRYILYPVSSIHAGWDPLQKWVFAGHCSRHLSFWQRVGDYDSSTLRLIYSHFIHNYVYGRADLSRLQCCNNWQLVVSLAGLLYGATIQWFTDCPSSTRDAYIHLHMLFIVIWSRKISGTLPLTSSLR